MKMSRLWVFAFVFPVLLAACGGDSGSGESTGEPSEPAAEAETAAPTPESTLAKLVELAEAGDWEAYVDDYYGEAHKLTDQDKRDQVVARFRDKWAEQVVTQLKSIADVTPELEEDGMIAVFRVDESSSFKLYKQDDGTWKYHL